MFLGNKISKGFAFGKLSTVGRCAAGLLSPFGALPYRSFLNENTPPWLGLQHCEAIAKITAAIAEESFAGSEAS